MWVAVLKPPVAWPAVSLMAHGVPLHKQILKENKKERQLVLFF
jgi:hypothetical protein